MSLPETHILEQLIARLDALQTSLANDLAWLNGAPKSVEEFSTMAPHRQTASKAVIKSFEQIEDQLSRAFRALPAILGEDSSDWFARDFADYMEKIGVLDAASAWGRVVRLRNKLVHDYPLDLSSQFAKFDEVIEQLELLAQTHRRLADFVDNTLPGKLP